MGRHKGSKNKYMEQFDDRFWRRVFVKFGDCWEWKGNLNTSGYGHFAYLGKMVTAHRASWVIHFGQIPDKLQVLHTCDNRKCVNPNHLFLGTNNDNVKDRDSKGRGKVPNIAGDNHWNSKLTTQDVVKMRKIWESKKFTQVEIGKMFGVSNSRVCEIVNGKAWEHVG